MEARIRMTEEQIQQDNAKSIRMKQMIEEQRKAIEDLALQLSAVEARRLASEKTLKEVTRTLRSSEKKSQDLEQRNYDEQVLEAYYNHQCERVRDEIKMEATIQADSQSKLLKLRGSRSRAYRASHSRRTTELATTMAAMVPVLSSSQMAPESENSTTAEALTAQVEAIAKATPGTTTEPASGSTILQERVTMSTGATFAAGFVSAADDLKSTDDLEELDVPEGEFSVRQPLGNN